MKRARPKNKLRLGALVPLAAAPSFLLILAIKRRLYKVWKVSRLLLPHDEFLEQLDYFDAIVPAQLAHITSKMSTTQHARAYVQNEMYGMALRRDLLLRNNILEKKVAGFEPALAGMRKEVWDAKSKAAMLLDEKLRAETKLNEVVKERDVLAAQESKAVADLGAEKERSASFHREMEALRASNALLMKEKLEAVAAHQKMADDFAKLRAAVPTIFYKAIASTVVMDPFNNLLEAAKKMQ